jgi:hypothetical protein
MTDARSPQGRHSDPRCDAEGYARNNGCHCPRTVGRSQGTLRAQQQVDNGLSTFLQSQYQVGHLRSSAQAASGALKIALEQYDQEATDFTTVLTAEQNLFQAESNLAVATANVPLGLTVVYRALGGGWHIRKDSDIADAATRDRSY